MSGAASVDNATLSLADPGQVIRDAKGQVITYDANKLYDPFVALGPLQVAPYTDVTLSYSPDPYDQTTTPAALDPDLEDPNDIYTAGNPFNARDPADPAFETAYMDAPEGEAVVPVSPVYYLDPTLDPFLGV